jgi:hypothetical protein
LGKWWLEPDVWKHTSPVLKGERSRKAPYLPNNLFFIQCRINNMYERVCMIGEKFYELYTKYLDNYLLLRVKTDCGFYEVSENYYEQVGGLDNTEGIKKTSLLNLIKKLTGKQDKEFEKYEFENSLIDYYLGFKIIDMRTDGEILYIKLENGHYISKGWFFVTGDGQTFQDISFSKEDDYDQDFHKEFNKNYVQIKPK